MAETICPFCDYGIKLFGKKTRRIFPKSLYSQLKGLRYLHGQYKVSIDDPRNLVVCCSDCFLSFADEMLVPDWSEKGVFSFFSAERLRAYADYFFSISYPLMHMFREAIPAPGAEESMVAVEHFRKEYEWRKKNDVWDIGFPFIEEKSYETYRKSAMESKKWWQPQ